MLGMEQRAPTDGAAGQGLNGEGLDEVIEEGLELVARLLDGGAPTVTLRCGADGAGDLSRHLRVLPRYPSVFVVVHPPFSRPQAL